MGGDSALFLLRFSDTTVCFVLRSVRRAFIFIPYSDSVHGSKRKYLVMAVRFLAGFSKGRTRLFVDKTDILVRAPCSSSLIAAKQGHSCASVYICLKYVHFFYQTTRCSSEAASLDVSFCCRVTIEHWQY